MNVATSHGKDGTVYMINSISVSNPFHLSHTSCLLEGGGGGEGEGEGELESKCFD